MLLLLQIIFVGGYNDDLGAELDEL